MSAANSTASCPRRKPSKPYPDFPLYAHAAGYWAKKIRGKLHYFGPWSNPDAALTKYMEQREALHAGRKPRPDPEALTVKQLANQFLSAKKALVSNGELSQRTWDDYKAATDMLVAEFGKQRSVADLAPDDFAALRMRMAEQWGPHRLGTTIQCIRCAFRFAFDAGLIERPIRYGPGFKRPSAKTMRLHRAKQGPKLFESGEVRRMLGCPPWRPAAEGQIHAMILLAINCGFGNADCGNLPLSALDLDDGWIDYPRPKTGVARRCPLWPETVHALRVVLAERKEPKDPSDAALVFVTRYGHGWAKHPTAVTHEFGKLLQSLDINGHRGFYALRHSFRTVADEAKDQPAVDHLMGHESPHMATVYRERISDERLKAVSAYVRGWLFGT